MRRSKAASTARRPASVRATAPARRMKLAARDLAVVDQREHGRVGQKRPEFLGQVQGQRRPAVTRAVVESEQRIEARGIQGKRPLLHQQGVDERQQGVDRIARRAAVAALDVELLAPARAAWAKWAKYSFAAIPSIPSRLAASAADSAFRINPAS